jgi:hypothetical protein
MRRLTLDDIAVEMVRDHKYYQGLIESGRIYEARAIIELMVRANLRFENEKV